MRLGAGCTCHMKTFIIFNTSACWQAVKEAQIAINSDNPPELPPPFTKNSLLACIFTTLTTLFRVVYLSSCKDLQGIATTRDSWHNPMKTSISFLHQI